MTSDAPPPPPRPHLFAAVEHVTQRPFSAFQRGDQLWSVCVCVCVWHHILLCRGSAPPASRLCSLSVAPWLHSLSAVWAGRFTEALTGRNADVSTPIVSPLFHDDRRRHASSGGGKWFPALTPVLPLDSFCPRFITPRSYHLNCLPTDPLLYFRPVLHSATFSHHWVSV